jgi:hypothetical protein
MSVIYEECERLLERGINLYTDAGSQFTNAHEVSEVWTHRVEDAGVYVRRDAVSA